MHSAIFYSSCFAFFFLFYTLSLTHHPHWFLNSVWKLLLWVSTAKSVSDPLGKTVTAWIRCQSHLILLVTKIVPRPCAHFSPPSATPSPKAYSALVSPWPRSLLTKTDGCLGLHPARPLASGATPVPGEGPEPQLQLQTARQCSPAVKSPGSEASLPRVQIPAVLLATWTTLVHLTNSPIREGSWVGKWPDWGSTVVHREIQTSTPALGHVLPPIWPFPQSWETKWAADKQLWPWLAQCLVLGRHLITDSRTERGGVCFKAVRWSQICS